MQRCLLPLVDKSGFGLCLDFTRGRQEQWDIMELVVFDLDGTLLGADHRISDFTADTLKRLTANNIAYTVATGRNLHSAQEIIRGHGFLLPHIYINGVIVWDPGSESLSLGNFLSNAEAEHVIRAAIAENVTPFVH